MQTFQTDRYADPVTPSTRSTPSALSRRPNVNQILRGGARATTQANAAAATTKVAPAQEQSHPPPTQSTINSISKSINSYTPSVPFLIRVLFLCYYGSLGALMPYLPVYYHSLGHGGLIIGMLGAVKPLTTFLVAPFWGILSDASTDKFRVLYMSFFVSLVGQLMVAVRTDVSFLLSMVFVTAVFNAPVKSLMDSIVLDHLPNKADYGRMRLWGQLGFGLGSSGVGILLSKSQHQTPETKAMAAAWMKANLPEKLYPILSAMYHLWMSITGYKLLFLGYAALSIPTWWALRAFEVLDRKKQQDDAATAAAINTKAMKRQRSSKTSPAKPVEGAKIMEGLRLLFTNADAILFFFLVFIVGTSSGVIENFAYVRMREVGGAGKEMGLSRLVSSAAGVPMFWFSGPLTERLGADRVMTLALASYVVRFYLYATMTNPYHGLPAEALRGVTFAAFWSTGTIYAHRISPPGMSTTMLMFLNAMYGGLGQSVGAILGGKLQSMFGTVRMFFYAGTFDLCFVAFLIVYLLKNQDSSFRNPKPIVAKSPLTATKTTDSSRSN